MLAINSVNDGALVVNMVRCSPIEEGTSCPTCVKEICDKDLERGFIGIIEASA
jgi:hypothetical protein